MKIGITCYPTYGGSGAIAAELGIHLSQRGHEVHFVSYALPFRLPTFQQNLFFHQVETMSYPLFEHSPYTITLAAKMVDVTQAEGLDLLHVHYAIPLPGIEDPPDLPAQPAHSGHPELSR
jgi:glycosyltransferase involved in cell wall biosynthesis